MILRNGMMQIGPKEKLKPIIVLFIVICSLVIGECSSPTIQNEMPDFNFLLKYGVGGRNEMNTFHGTLTKDLIVDSSITISFRLSNDELSVIRDRLYSIRFFDYPDTMKTQHKGRHIKKFVAPHDTYFLRVQLGTQTKAVFWEDSDLSDDARAIALRSTIKLIRGIIETRPEYQRLPKARGGYF
jgi:hypothetical protein